jgi:hypothetical protein
VWRWPSCCKVKTAWSFTSTFAICLRAMKPKHENNLLFVKVLSELVSLCYIHCCLSHLIQLEHFQHCLYTMIEICRLFLRALGVQEILLVLCVMIGNLGRKSNI